MVPFNVNRSQMNFKFTQRIEIPQCPGGGVPSSPFFYKNPQFLISADRSKVVNWAVNSKIPFQALISYTCRDSATHVKAFLCNSNLNNYRISTINDETVVNLAQKSVSQSLLPVAHTLDTYSNFSSLGTIQASKLPFEADAETRGLLHACCELL